MKPIRTESMENAGKLVPRASTPESRQRAVQTRYAEAALHREKAIPYLVRGGIIPLVSRYIGATESQTTYARNSLRKEGLIPKALSADARSMVNFDTERLRSGVNPDLQNKIRLGRQLVVKGYLTADVAIWQLMFDEYKAQNLDWDPLEGFPEKLILEGFFTSQLKADTKLDQAIRTALKESQMMDTFEPELDLLAQIAERRRAVIEKTQ